MEKEKLIELEKEKLRIACFIEVTDILEKYLGKDAARQHAFISALYEASSRAIKGANNE